MSCGKSALRRQRVQRLCCRARSTRAFGRRAARGSSKTRPGKRKRGKVSGHSYLACSIRRSRVITDSEYCEGRNQGKEFSEIRRWWVSYRHYDQPPLLRGVEERVGERRSSAETIGKHRSKAPLPRPSPRASLRGEAVIAGV